METPSKSVGDVFAESLRREQEAAEAAMAPATEYAEDYNPFVTEDDPEALVDSLWNTSLPLLKDQYDSTPEGNKRNAIKFVLSDKTNKFLDELAAQPGYENRVRFLAQRKRDKEIDQRFVDASMGLMVEAAKQPPADLSGKDLSAAVDSIDPIFGDLVDGLYGVATYSLPAAVEAFKSIPVESYFPLGMGTTLAARKIDKLLGVERPPEKIEETPNINLLVTAAQQSNYETVRLLQRFGRLYALSRSMDDPKKFAEYFSEDKVRKRVNDDLKMYDTMIALERGQADMIGPEGKPTGETKQVVRPEDVPLIQPVGELLGAENILPGFAGAKVASLPVREAVETAAMRLTTTAARQLERQAAEKAVRESVSLPRQVVGTAVEMAGRGAEKVAESPIARGIVGAGAAVATGGTPTTVLLTTIGAGTRAGRQAATFFPKIITGTGEFIKKPVTGPFKAMADYVTDVGKAGLAGTTTMIPPALIAETPEERGSLLAGGLVYGAAGGGLERARTGIKNSISDFGRSFFKPDQTVVSESQRVAPTSYGIPNLDAAHAAYVAEMPADQANRVEALRELIGRKNKLFVLSPDQFDSLVPQQGEKAPEGVRAAGVAIRNNADGTSTAYVRGGRESLFHETGHVIFNSLPEATKKNIRDSVLEGYTQPELQQMLDYYTTRGIDVPNLNSLIDEIIAENYQVALNGGPLGRLGTPLGLAGRIYSSIGTLAERVGVRGFVPGTDVVTSSALRFTPSFIVNNAIRNGFEAMRLDEAGAAAVPEIVGTPEAAPAPEEAPAEAPAAAPAAPEAVPAAEVAPEAPAAPVEAPAATPEAQDLINKIDSGGASPAFISRNLERIANENGVEVTPQMTPKDVIDALREKTAAPAPAETPVEAPAAAPEAAPEAAAAPAPVEAAAAPTPAPAVPPNVRNVTEARRARFVQPTEQQVEANRQKLAQMASRPRGQQEYVEVDYLSAVSDEKSPNAEIRREQRALADAAEQETPGYTNPLRAVFQKVFAPYRVGDTPNTVYGFSFDKLVQNVDILSGWLRRNQDAAAQINLPYPLTSPQLAADVNTYLRNQSNGYGGDGTRLTRPADAVGITPENPNYTPVRLDRPVTNLINMLMGLEPAQKLTKNEEFNLRFAELNGLIPERTKKGGIEPNPLRNQFRQAGFNTKLLNGVLENLRVDRIGANVVSRPDLALPVGEGAFTRIGFMLEQDPVGKYSKGRLEPLEGAPRIEGASGPDPRLIEVAEKYALENGINLVRQAEFVQVDEDRARRIAQAYEEMPNDPENPEVKKAYEDLIRQTKAQYQALEEAGYQFWFYDNETDPYAGNPWSAMRDLRANKRMAVYSTDAGFGSGVTALDLSKNPLLEDTGIEWSYGSPTGPKRRVLANDLFRAVHDAFGHGIEGAGFRARGEENAWQAHVRLFTGDAVKALTTETRGQNSWLNYGPYGEKNRAAKIGETIFGDQKTGLLPDWTWTEGRAADAKPKEPSIDQTGDEFFDQRFDPEANPVATVQYMLEDEKLLPKNVQFKQSKRPGSVGGVIPLVHFSSVEYRNGVLNPKKTSGKGAATATDLRGLERGYFYKVGTQYEAQISSRPNIYSAVVDGNAIYDLNSDPLGYGNIINREKADQMLIDEGFVGMRGKVGPTEMVAVFKPIKVQDATPEEVFSQRALAARRRQAREYGAQYMLEDTPEETPEAPLANETLRKPSVSSVAIRTGEETIDLGERPGVLDIGKALAARSRKAKRIPYESRTTQAKEAIATALADEIEYAAAQNNSAIGWYEAKIDEAMQLMEKVHPEFATDPDRAAFYKAILAITSNGQSVVSNFERAEKLYRQWKVDGKLDTTSSWGGDRADGINKGLTVLQKLVDSRGLEGTRQFLTTQYRFGDLKKLAKRDLGIDIGSSELADYQVYGSVLFGPKVGGGFFPNLNGDFSPITMDLWLMRTWNRINGSYGQKDVAGMKRAMERLRTAARENPDLPGSAEVLAMSDRQLTTWAEKKFAEWGQKRKFKNADVFDKPAKALTEAKEGAMESPRNGSERQWIRQVFTEVDRKLADRGLPPINNADKQAILWYYEKDLYSKLGYASKRGKPADYADAARRVLDSYGIAY